MLAQLDWTRWAVLLAAALLSAPTVSAQTGRSWSDPPAELSPQSPLSLQPVSPGTEAVLAPVPGVPRATVPQAAIQPSQPDVSVETAQPQQPSREIQAPGAPSLSVDAKLLRRAPADTGSERERAARDLAIAYLDLWSAPNELTLEATQAFYGPRVLFHGQVMSARALLEEKRRFVERWPVRRYRHRAGTIEVACEIVPDSCIVRSIFDFTAASPRRGKRSHGTGVLELVVSFAGERPVIAAEHSAVLRARAGTARPIVQICRDAIAAAAIPYGLVRLEAAAVGTLEFTEDGYIAPIEFRVVYSRLGGLEARHAVISCRVNKAGQFVAAR